MASKKKQFRESLGKKMASQQADMGPSGSPPETSQECQRRLRANRNSYLKQWSPELCESDDDTEGEDE
jgi:hypothetical protein